VASLHTNVKLKELDIANNKVGAAESLNAVFPDTVTGNAIFFYCCIYESLIDESLRRRSFC
jgi:hypothetical protein